MNTLCRKSTMKSGNFKFQSSQEVNQSHKITTDTKIKSSPSLKFLLGLLMRKESTESLETYGKVSRSILSTCIFQRDPYISLT